MPLDTNRLSTIIMAASIMMQGRDNGLAFSGEQRAQLLLRELASFMGAYTAQETLFVGLLPTLHYRLIQPLSEHCDRDDLGLGMPGTISTNEYARPRVPKGKQFIYLKA